MAAFSHQHHPFLLDSVFLPNTPIKMYGFVDEGNVNTNTTFFSQYFPSDQTLIQDTPVDVGIHESSCLEHSSSKAVYSDNETSVTKKLSTDSSSMVDRLVESGEQVTQKVMMTSMDKKRKNRDGSTLSSAQSKDAREGKGRKERKCNGGLSNVEVKKFTADKEQKKVAEEAPSGYIHVRARRGQATDSHSLAERVRREKISERMKLLQALVPGCDKVTGKALMLDEIINYVQSLQNQVEFLSMKLASLNPMIYNFGVDPDAFTVRQENLSELASPLPSVQQCSPTPQPTAFADRITTTTFTTPPANQYSLIDPSLLLQQGQRLNPFIQDNGSLLWDVDGQKQKIIHQSGLISNNMCCFN